MDQSVAAEKPGEGRAAGRRSLLGRTVRYTALAVIASMLVTAAIELVFVVPFIPDVDLWIGMAIGAGVALLTATPTIYIFLSMQQRLTELLGQVHHLAGHDDLTGLRNRRSFLAEAARGYEASGRPAALLLIDIDHFKAVNDDYGHACGDAVLQRTAAAVERVAETTGALSARLGGEEFVLMLTIEKTEDAALVADAVRRYVEAQQVNYLGARLSVTVSIGVAAAPGGFRTDWLMSLADKALYRAKAEGRNRVVWYPAQAAAARAAE
ncbi:GGDEF domain-containing protein [Methylobrevis albus]|uniref:diguanylate cyclase n=1 Tax=Methylobrevis albus TaxID=2793297 RepID=A0A931I0H1_9HYPH|nr:GGDEF domain-containing protein [Methylobrevis albus]MBH0237080.1 GGDEF domain-containing protein [Methylobrevis albus]